MKYFFIAFTAAILVVACSPQTTEIIDTTEEVSEEVNETVTSLEVPEADVVDGKGVFTASCVRCHYGTGPTSAQAIKSFSKEQYDAIFPKMIENAKLNSDQARQVKAYVYWELEQ